MELQQLRERSGLSREQVADATEINRATLYRIETAQAKPQIRTLRALLETYGVPEKHRNDLIAILRSAQEESWLQVASEDLPDQYATYIGFEQEAKGIRNYESSFVPGLLQTEAYARAAIPGGAPELPATEVESRVTVRMARQAKRDPSPAIEAIIDEAALRRHVGSLVIMREQLQRLLDESEQAHVTLQVIPFEAGAHPGMHGSFVILQFADDVRDVVYIEASTTDLFLNSENDVRRYNLMFEHLRSVALSPEKTRDLIASVLVDVRVRGGAGDA
ncbi:helix-turn-helix domain-containing protein (plasmid) [Streptosporangium sp. CA-135522]|uniref:helix-turn-helix domain-containing protein n=1 Tax=Streptosporangium sp. CA-135522 TaxID=3240072 RepID=UPI003D94FA66